MGREEDRKRFERQRISQSIDRSLAGTAQPPMDRFGVRLKLGDLVLYSPTYPTLFQVSEIVPVLDPSAPAGTVQLILSGVVPLVLNPNQPCISVVHVESPEGAEQAIKRHHAGRAVSGENGGGSGIAVVDGEPGHVRNLRVTRPDGDEGGSQGGSPGADAEGGGSVPSDSVGAGAGEGDRQGPGDQGALASTDPLNHPSQADRDDGSAFHHANLADLEAERARGTVTDTATGSVSEPVSGNKAGVGSAASGVGASDIQNDHPDPLDVSDLDNDKG